MKNILKRSKIMLQLTLNPGLTLTGFRTTRPRGIAVINSWSKLTITFGLWHAISVKAFGGYDRVCLQLKHEISKWRNGATGKRDVEWINKHRKILQEKLDGGVQPAFQTLTPFMTKICYPSYDLTKHFSLIRDMTHNKHNLWNAFVDGLVDNNEKNSFF